MKACKFWLWEGGRYQAHLPRDFLFHMLKSCAHTIQDPFKYTFMFFRLSNIGWGEGVIFTVAYFPSELPTYSSWVNIVTFHHYQSHQTWHSKHESKETFLNLGTYPAAGGFNKPVCQKFSTCCTLDPFHFTTVHDFNISEWKMVEVHKLK